MGAKTDYDDTNAAIETVEDWCLNNLDDTSNYCKGLNSPEYQAYVEKTTNDGGIPMDYYSWTSSTNVKQDTAETKEGEIMAVRHRDMSVWGVQFHPESLATQHGVNILKNFLDPCKTEDPEVS